MAHLDVEDLLRLTRVLGAGPVRDLGLLDTAANRPQASALGEGAYPTTETKAAALLHSVVSSHPLVDGGKRLGWPACVVLLDLKGLRPDVTDEEAFRLVMRVAEAGSTTWPTSQQPSAAPGPDATNPTPRRTPAAPVPTLA